MRCLETFLCFLHLSDKLALASVETLLQLEQLLDYSEEHLLDLMQVDLLLQEQWSSTHWMAATAHFSS